MQSRLVSVIVPIFNMASYLDKCLDSITNQTYKDIEIICIDDGSSDSSPTILKQYADSDDRITIITKENEGVAKARNIGLQQSVGKYICFVDPDDWISTEFVEKTVNAIESTMADLVIVDHCDCDDEKITPITVFGNNEPSTEYFLKMMIAGFTWGILYRASYKDELMFQENITIGEDLAMLLPLITNHDNLYYLNETLYYYRINKKSATFQRSNVEKKKTFLDACKYAITHSNEKYHDLMVYTVAKRIIYNNMWHLMYLNAYAIEYVNNNLISYFKDNEYILKDEKVKKILQYPTYSLIPNTVYYDNFGNKKLTNVEIECIKSWKENSLLIEVVELNENNCDVSSSPAAIQQLYKSGKYSLVGLYYKLLKIHRNGGISLSKNLMINTSLDSLRVISTFFGFAENNQNMIFGSIANTEIINQILRVIESNDISHEMAYPIINDLVAHQRSCRNNDEHVDDEIIMFKVITLPTLDYHNKKIKNDYYINDTIDTKIMKIRQPNAIFIEDYRELEVNKIISYVRERSNEKANILFFGYFPTFNEKICVYIDSISKLLKTHRITIVSEGSNVDINRMREKYSFDMVQVPKMLERYQLLDEIDLATSEEDNILIESKTYLKFAVELIRTQYNTYDDRAIGLVAQIYRFYVRIIQASKPDRIVMWNEYFVHHFILSKLLEEIQLPYYVMEYGSITGTYSLELFGSFGKSFPSICSDHFCEMKVTDDEIKESEIFIKKHRNGRYNQYPQPKTDLKRITEAKKDRHMILYVGTPFFDCGFATGENNRIFNCPSFSNDIEVLLFLRKLCLKNNWLLVYKPHPIQNRDLCLDGVLYIDKCDINDIFDLADAIVMVASKTSYNAMIRNKAVVTLGYSQINFKGCVYEAFSKDQIEKSIIDAISVGVTPDMHNNFVRHVAQMQHYLFDDCLKKDWEYGLKVNNAVQVLETSLDDSVSLHYDDVFSYNIGYYKKEIEKKYNTHGISSDDVMSGITNMAIVEGLESNRIILLKSNQELTKSNQELTKSNQELTKSNQELTKSNQELTKSNQELTLLKTELENRIVKALKNVFCSIIRRINR